MVRGFVISILVPALPLASLAGGQASDEQLTKLMIGSWRSPRHDYVFQADGSWWMGKPDPKATHGGWKIERGRLIQTVWGPYFEQFLPFSDDPIKKLTRDGLVF